MSRSIPWARLLTGALLLLCLCGTELLFAQSCLIQTDDPSPVCQGSLVTYTVTGLPPQATQIVWVTPGGTQTTQGNSVSVYWDHVVTTSVTANLFNNQKMPVGSCTLTPVVVQEKPAPMIVPQIAPGCGHKDGVVGGGARYYCQNSILTFDANGGGGNYAWTVTGSAQITPPPTGNEIEVITGSGGSFTLDLWETNSAGCVGHTQETYQIAQPPVVSFSELSHTSNPIEICKGESLVFTGTATDPNGLAIEERIWKVFNSGNTLLSGGTGGTFSYVFSTSGTYTVTFTATNCAGCSATSSVTVEVTEESIPNIICPSVVCEDGPLVEYCTDAPCTGFNWSVGPGGAIISGQGTPCIEVAWTSTPSSGFGTVTLNTSNCPAGVCPEPVTIEVPILNSSTGIVGPSSSCNPNASLSYSLPNWPGALYSWSINNVVGVGTVAATGAADFYIYNLGLTNFTGSFTVHAVVSHPLLGCKFEYDKKVVVGAYTITGAKVYCSGENVVLNISPPPAAGFTATWSVQGQTWNSGPLTGTQVTIPASVFPTSNTYIVNVTITLATGEVLQCTSSSIYILHPVDPVTEILGAQNICLNQPYTYTAIPGAGFGGSISWNAIGGTPDPTVGNPIHVTWTANNPPYQLTAIRSEFIQAPGNSGKVCQSAPFTRSDFTRIPIPSTLKIKAFVKPCADHEFMYQANYDGATNYLWSVDPTLGSIVSGQGTSKVVIYWNLPLSSNHLATINLSATVCGQVLTASLTLEILVGPTPVISGPEAICEGSSAIFTATVSGWGVGASYDWEVEHNGSIVHYLTTAPTLTVPANMLHVGPGIVRVTVTTTTGCTGSGGDAFHFTVVANPKPGISTPDSPLCKGNKPIPFTMTLYGQDYSGLTASYAWTHNGQTVGMEPSYTVNIEDTQNDPDYGIYTLTVGHTYPEYPGLTCYASYDYLVGHANCESGPRVPRVEFKDWKFVACGEVEVYGYTDEPVDPWEDHVEDARWRVEDFAGTVDPNPHPIVDNDGIQHTILSVFSKPGFYPTWLEIKFKDPSGQPYPAYSASRRVIEIPVAPDFKWSANCGSTAGTYDATFSDLSELIPGPPGDPNGGTHVNSWLWTIDGVVVSTDANFNYSFNLNASAQTHEVCLTVTSATVFFQPGMPYTCTICKTITIPGQSTIAIAPENTVVCEGTPIQFHATYNANDIVDLIWNFDDGTGSHINDPIKTYNYVPGHDIYHVTATFTDNYGCVIVRNATVQINDNTLSGVIVVSRGECSSKATLTFEGTPPVEHHLWSPGGATSASLMVVQSGVYSVTVTDDETHCSFSPVPKSVIVQPPFVAGILGPRRICRGSAISLSVVAVPDYTFNWVSSTGNMSTINVFSIPAIDIPAGTNAVTVTVTASQNGHVCATESVVVHIDPSPPVPIFSYNYICPPYPITVSALGSALQPLPVSWSSGNGSFLGYGPQITRFGAGFISATVVNEYGCQAVNGVNLVPPPRINMLAGCYTICDTALNSNIPILPIPTIANGPIVSWEWIHNGVGQGVHTALPIIPLANTQLVGETYLHVKKRFFHSNGMSVICDFDSDIFCLEVETCGPPPSCRPPGPVVNDIVCLQETEVSSQYYIHWSVDADGVDMPCQYAQNLPIRNAAGMVIGNFTAIDHELLPYGPVWHFEGLFTINAPYGPFDACWEIPFCLISTGELCTITTVCTDTGDPKANDATLTDCEGTSCGDDLIWTMDVRCENNPATPATHLISLSMTYLDVPDLPTCNKYDVYVNTTTGTTVPANDLIIIQGATADANGNLVLTPATYPQLAFDWYDQIGTDIICLQANIRYDDQCYLPPNYPQDGRICTQRFCVDYSDHDCSPERHEENGEYHVRSSCQGPGRAGIYTYTFEIEFLQETTIAGYGFILGQTSGNAVLLSATGNRISGVYYSSSPNAVFQEGIVIRRPDGSIRNYRVEALLSPCTSGGGDIKGKSRSTEQANFAALSKTQLTLAPNPATDQVYVQFQLPVEWAVKPSALVIHNSLGALVWQQPLETTNSGGLTLSLGSLPSGWYQVSLMHDTHRVATQKLVLVKP